MGPKLKNERRLNEVLRIYWDELRGNRPYPDEDDLDLDELLPIWDACFVLQARDVALGKDYNFTYLGPYILHAYDSGHIPFPIPGVVHLEAAHLAPEFERMFAQPEPVIHEGTYPLPQGRELRYRQIILPLSHRAGSVEALVGRLGYRIYEPEEQ